MPAEKQSFQFSKTIRATEIPLTTNLQMIAVAVSLPNPISICNMYLPNSQPLNLQDLKDLIN